MNGDWITEEELAVELKTNVYNIRQLALDGELQPYREDQTPLIIYEGGTAIELPGGNYATRNGDATANDIAGCIYRKSEVNKYKENPVPMASSDKKLRKTDIRKAVIYSEAKTLRIDNPKMNRVDALKKVNNAITKYSPTYLPIKQSQFNRITEDLCFPLAKRGNPHNKTEK